MATDKMTPGVYIDEINAFPGSAVAVETAVPVFIGYTEKAMRRGKSLVGIPTSISSFAEYAETFGGAFKPKFKITQAADGEKPDPAAPTGDTIMLNGKHTTLKLNDNNAAYFYNCIRLFYANGGAHCYIYSVGTYGTTPEGFTIKTSDFVGGTTTVFGVLEKEYEPTLIVMPDIIALGKSVYNDVYAQVLLHCAKVKSRMGIFDLHKQDPSEGTDDIVAEFRNGIGTTSLKYGAAYYPWLKTSIVQPDEVDFQNFDASVVLTDLLAPTETTAKDIITAYNANAKKADPDVSQNYHQSLKAASPTYVTILDALRSRMNELPPSAAMAGIYTLVDNSRGVWKAPANVSLSMVNEPSFNISSDGQEKLNVDVMAGKSINVIRPFPGIGTLVWGARTLDGNSQDWRYINVRRTLIMIEQSLKLATRAYVFEPNDAGTWITVKSMFNNFLVNLWKQGALAGAVPEQAFDVQIGLGATMTPTDILDGLMKITVKVAVVRPAEFIVITFQQQQQLS